MAAAGGICTTVVVLAVSSSTAFVVVAVVSWAVLAGGVSLRPVFFSRAMRRMFLPTSSPATCGVARTKLRGITTASNIVIISDLCLDIINSPFQKLFPSPLYDVSQCLL